MANNRMYLVCGEERVFIAKYYPSTGWYTTGDLEERLNAAFHKDDFGDLTLDQITANGEHKGFGVPYPSLHGMFGNTRWKIEYEAE